MPHERIETNPGIMAGKPFVRGPRVPVELVLRKLGALTDHPRLKHDDIHAAQAFAADYIAVAVVSGGSLQERGRCPAKRRSGVNDLAPGINLA
jgi:uncharacterized protein (DUF433 family)